MKSVDEISRRGLAMLSLAALPCLACCLASPLRVVHETSGMLFLYKPPGLTFHSSPSSPGLLASVRAMQSSGGFPHAGRLYAVHRLDRVTSGLLMLAKTPAAARDVASLLRARRVHKYYVALTSRRPAKKCGVVRGDMQRSRRGQWRLLRTAENPATTRFLSTPVHSGGRALRALLLRPISGRTHQLRVAMKAVGAALLGDEMYDAAERARMEERTYLHAGALRLPGSAAISGSAEPVQVICPPAEGGEFLSEGFVSLWRDWFPDSLVEPGLASYEPVWFAGTAVESTLFWDQPIA